MNELRIDDLVSGEYYHCDVKEGSYDFEMVFKYSTNHGDENRPFCYYLLTTDSLGEYHSTSCCYITGRKTRKATEEEAIWLDECANQGKYLTKNSIYVSLLKIKREIGLQ